MKSRINFFIDFYYAEEQIIFRTTILNSIVLQGLFSLSVEKDYNIYNKKSFSITIHEDDISYIEK